MTIERGAGHQPPLHLQGVIFDWGNTLMRDLGYPGPMFDWPRVELIPGVRKALKVLSGRLRLFVASNAGDSDAGRLGQALERVDILSPFERLWTSRELGFRKPDSRFFLEAVRRTGLPPSALAAVGDDYARDIVPAGAAGLFAVWFREPGTVSGEIPPGSAPAADAVLSSWDRLPEVLAGL